MHSGPDRRRHPRRRSFANQKQVSIRVGTAARASTLIARLIDCSAGGVRVETFRKLDIGSVVQISGELEHATGKLKIEGPCNVRWVAELSDGKFLSGLAFETPAHESNEGANGDGAKAGDPQIDEPSATFVDHYEILQVSRKADAETIKRIFHILVARFHPDNQESGDAEKFRQVVEAHDTLCDTERRAAFDADLAAQAVAQQTVINDAVTAQSQVENEISRRQQILRMLYSQRIAEPHSPSVGVRDFEEAFQCSREKLEFCFWFLKESRLVTRSDNNRFEITVQGVAVFEGEERSGGANGYTGSPYGPRPFYRPQIEEPAEVH